MGQINIREVVLLGLTTVTTSGSGPDINVIQAWQAATVTLNVQTVSGTTPTMNVFIQRKLGQAAATDTPPNPPTGTAIYDDLLAFTTITTSTTIRISNLCCSAFANANSSLMTAADWGNTVQALPVSNQRIGPLSGIWKVGYVISGTLPSFAFTVTTQLVPFST